MIEEFAANISLGMATAMSTSNLLLCLLGVTLGTVIGLIPGLGTLAAISMLYPFTFHLDPIGALVMLAGIYYGTSYGGSTASILLNLPGTPANAVTCLDGYPMARQGRAGVALMMTTVASFVGGSLGIIIMMLFAPGIAEFALRFGSAEYFALMLLGLVASSVISIGSPVKGIAMVVLGVFLGVVGTDVETGARRFTFGLPELSEGLSIVAIAMGVFGLAEVIGSIRTSSTEKIKVDVSIKGLTPTRDDVRRSWMPMLRGTGIGAFFGALPGTGGNVAAFMSYVVEKRVAKEPERFGNGAIEGIMAPETANNAADQTAFIPTMTLGIPGSASMALMLGVLMIHGINPGPTMMAERPDLYWGVVMSFWIGNVLLVILNLPLVGLWVRILMIPYQLLYPAIVMFICIGAYTVNNNAMDVATVVVFGFLGYGMRQLDLPAAPLLLGFVLGPMMEEHFRRAMTIARGDFTTFLSRPLALSILILCVVMVIWGIWSSIKDAKRMELRLAQQKQG